MVAAGAGVDDDKAFFAAVGPKFVPVITTVSPPAAGCPAYGNVAPLYLNV